MSETLTVDDVLSARAGFEYATEIRSIGPALVIVIEKEAPIRFQRLADTVGDRLALEDWIRDNEPAHEITFAFAKAKALEEVSGGGADRATRRREALARDMEHEQRLAGAERADPLVTAWGSAA